MKVDNNGRIVSRMTTRPVWLTRERYKGNLLSYVLVWTRRPTRIVLADGDVRWRTGPSVEDLEGYEGWIDVVQLPVVPDNDSQCIRLGREVVA